jgi:alpha-tubulin suppressor-like RCC1 family protein
VTKDFTLAANKPTATLNMDRLPLGSVAISGAAYAATCGTGATLYVADSASAVLETGVVTTLPLTFRKNNPVTANVNFVGNIQALSAGAQTTAILIDGLVYTWGKVPGTSSPTLVSGLTNVVDVEVGGYGGVICAVKSDGTVWCWGSNSHLATGVVGGFTSLAAGGHHFCAGKQATRETKCWGYNSVGQLGNFSTTSTASPVSFGLLANHFSPFFAGGFEHTCTVSGSTLQVFCVGGGAYGQLGNGGVSDQMSHTLAIGVAPAQDVTAGLEHTCALLADGSAKCWGWNMYGQLGDNTMVDRSLPVSVNGLAGATSLKAGTDFNCARLSNGSMKCWGDNMYGQLGDGSLTARFTPVPVAGLPDPVELIATGEAHTCAVTEKHELYCWGKNVDGQLGTSNYLSSVKPQKVTLP